MSKTISTVGMSREEWLKLRKTGIGGSDVGAICGVNPYSSPMKVYQDKITEEINKEDKESIRQGRDLEEYVAKRFMEATGFSVRRSNKMYRKEEYPFMIANIDRLIIGEDAGLECKTASVFQEDKWKDGKIPLHYLLQCLHYMAVTEKREWYIAVVILGRDFMYRKITWNEELIQKLIKIEETFWNKYVLPKVMPVPDGSKACDELLAQYFPTGKKKSCIPLVAFDEKLKKREELICLIEQLEQKQKQIEQEIKFAMKENEQAFTDKYRISWANVDTTKLDTKRIKEELPEVYQQFSKTTTSRYFRVKHL